MVKKMLAAAVLLFAASCFAVTTLTCPSVSVSPATNGVVVTCDDKSAPTPPPTMPPPSDVIACSAIPGITSTTVVALPWNHTSGLTSTRAQGGFPAGKAFVFKFTPPSGYSATATGRFSMVPTDANAYNNRFMVLSDKPCDLSGSLGKGAAVSGLGPTIYFTVGAYAKKTVFGQSVDDTSVPKLNAGQTYYVTVVQQATPGGENTCFAASCDGNYSLYNPSGN